MHAAINGPARFVHPQAGGADAALEHHLPGALVLKTIFKVLAVAAQVGRVDAKVPGGCGRAECFSLQGRTILLQSLL